MANILSLFGTILIDNTSANKNIDETTQKGEKASTKLGTAFKAIGNAAVKMGKATVGAASAVSVGVYKLASSTSEHADEVDKVSQKLGMSRTAYQEWDYVLSQAGVDITSMQTGLKTLTNKLDDAKNGSSKATAMFDKLGLSMEDLQGMSREDVFAEIIKSMQSMEDSTERAALANDLFGKSGQELTALFNTTAEATENLKNKAHELGMVMSDDAVQAGVDLHDTLDTAKRSIGSLKNIIGSAAIPVIQKVTDLLIKGMPKIQSLFAKATPIINKLFDGIVSSLFTLIGKIAPVILKILETLLPTLNTLSETVLPVISTLIEELLPPLLDIAQQILPTLTDLIVPLVSIVGEAAQMIIPPLISIIQALIPPLMEIIQSVLPPITELINRLLPLVKEILDRVLPIIIQLIEELTPIVVNVIENLLPPIIDLIEQLLPPIMEIIDAVLPIVIELLDAILPLLTDIINAILPILIDLINQLMPILQPVLDVLKQILEPIGELLKVLLPPLMTLIKTLFETLLPGLKGAFEAVSKIVSGPVKTALDTIGKVIGTIKDVLGGVITFIKDVFTGNWEGAWTAIKDLFGNIFGAIVELFKAPINFIIDGINFFIDGLNCLKIPDWVPGIGGFGIDIPNIPRLRVGIDYVPHDDFPAVLHKGEQVLTDSERKEYQEYRDGDKDNGKDPQPVNVTVSVNIEKIENNTDKDIDDFIETIMYKIEEQIERKGVVFG